MYKFCKILCSSHSLIRPSFGAALALVASAAWAENLYFNPQNTEASCAGNFGNKIYNSLNWTNAQGVATQPKEGDVLYANCSGNMTCNGGGDVKLGGFIVSNNSSAINQGTLHLLGGGLGFEDVTSRSFYGTLYAGGPGIVPVKIPSGSSFSVQVQINGDNGAVIEKRGMGTLALIDGSNWASALRSTLSSFVIKAGQVAWRPTGNGGKLNPTIQTFPQNHRLVFVMTARRGIRAVRSTSVCVTST